jgi:hypothetical protein
VAAVLDQIGSCAQPLHSIQAALAADRRIFYLFKITAKYHTEKNNATASRIAI